MATARAPGAYTRKYLDSAEIRGKGAEGDLSVDEDGNLPFHARCPNGHLTVQRHRAEEWKAGLANDRLMFQIRGCGACRSASGTWMPF